jgi:purine-nucleoside phosphorylase
MIQEAAQYLKRKVPFQAKTGIILGSGLGGLVDQLEIKCRISYAEIPGFPVSTVEGHSGELIFGFLNEHALMVMSGRFHYYEDYTMETVVFPIRVMRLLGIERLVITNAAGGLNPDFEVGDIMLIEDVISLLPDNPLRGANEEGLGPKIADRSAPFDLDWMEKADFIAEGLGLYLKKGVYVGVQGPKLETKAEIRYLRIIGGDAVGMSTVPEVIAAHHLGMKVLAFSVITNESIPKIAKEFTHKEVVAVAKSAGDKLVNLVKGII